MTGPTIVASVLNADLDRLGDVCRELEDAGLDAIQWDVMDGHFVPNLTLGPDVIKACRAATKLPFEAHLMIDAPEQSMQQYIDAGCEYVIVQAETCRHLHRTLDQIREGGGRAGVALNPSTPLEDVANVMDLVDLLLVMTVNPGFGGQSYISTMEPKIEAARAMIKQRAGSGGEASAAALEVDGGIAQPTIRGAATAGADRFVVGSALYRGEHGIAGVVRELHEALELNPAGTSR